MTKPITYKSAGVDIDTQDTALRQVRKLARGTFNADTLSELGLFGGLYRAAFPGLDEPVLVASADGVGTKLRLAFQTGIVNTVGRDLVNHCVNDILVQGARPLFFLDYFASGRLKGDTLIGVVDGIARGCRENGCVLLGGETAEMPGFYADGEFDVAGFIVGVVDRRHILDGTRVKPGDVLLGIPAVGLHTNGYSLARKVLMEHAGFGPHDTVPELNMTVAQALLAEHPSYLKPLEGLLHHPGLHALAHITGGGLTDNVPRILPDGTHAVIRPEAWELHPLCRSIMERGNVPREEMLRATNFGIGMVVVVDPASEKDVRDHLLAHGLGAPRIGLIEAGEERRVLYR